MDNKIPEPHEHPPCLLPALHNFGWIDDYFRKQALQAEVEELMAERNLITALPSDQQKAPQNIPSPAASQQSKENTIERLTNRIQEVEKEIEAVFHDRFRGRDGQDTRELFVRYWADIQGTCNSPVNHKGLSLEKYGTAAERMAWDKLKMADFINIKNGLDPHDPDRQED